MLLASNNYKVSEEAVTIAAMVSCAAAVFYRPKEKQMQADRAHHAFHRGGVGDHIALLMVYNDWKETNFAVQFCYENFIQIRTMNRVRDIRDQLIGLIERVEIAVSSNTSDLDGIR